MAVLDIYDTLLAINVFISVLSILVSLSVDCRERRQTPGARSKYGRSYIELYNSEASRQQSATHKIDIDDVSSVLSALTCSRSRRLPVDASYSRFVLISSIEHIYQ